MSRMFLTVPGMTVVSFQRNGCEILELGMRRFKYFHLAHFLSSVRPQPTLFPRRVISLSVCPRKRTTAKRYARRTRKQKASEGMDQQTADPKPISTETAQENINKQDEGKTNHDDG